MLATVGQRIYETILGFGTALAMSFSSPARPGEKSGPQNSNTQGKTAIFGYAVFLAFGVLLAVAVRLNAHREYATARTHFIQTQQAEAHNVAQRANAGLRAIYENIRTISYLPSVRNIDRHGENLGEEGREVIQQIYNNLYSNISVSEVYIVPEDLNPDKIDSRTGKPEEPILMFDSLIAHPKSGQEKENTSGLRGGNADDDLEEVEIFEYRQLRDQFTWLRKNAPNRGVIRGLDVPFISGPEIITCDNTKFIDTRSDADRAGVIFSSPFFGPDGKLKGSISAVILNRALRGLIPARNFALINPGYQYASQPSESGQERSSATFLRQGEVDPALIYSEVIPLSLGDPEHKWELWAGVPNAEFYDGVEAVSIRAAQRSGYFIVGLVMLVGTVSWTLFRRGLRLSLSEETNRALERRVAERTLEINHLATHDPLTGLPNRTLLLKRLNDILSVRQPLGREIALLYVDLDRFKLVNDTLGHPIGDLLLKAVAERLGQTIGTGDIVARLGGDEFVIVLPDVGAPEHLEVFADRLVEVIAESFTIGGHTVNIGVSIGIAIASESACDAEDLLRNADLALYRAKTAGRGTSRRYEPGMEAKLHARRQLEVDLRRALSAGQFELYYQPQVDTQTEAIVGFEALLRWNHPTRGVVSPMDFIPLAEETGLIIPLGEWIIRQACIDATTWPKPLKVAINLSPVQFKNQTLVHGITLALAQSGLSPSRVEFEITEAVLLEHNEIVLTTLHQIRALGITIAMDDFGTGYSSLSYLRSFPFDKIKIDRSFVRDLSEKTDGLAIIKAVAGLGVSLGIATTAEGVETREQLDLVRSQGCNEIQGYYYGRPAPNAEILKALNSGPSTHESADRLTDRKAS